MAVLVKATRADSNRILIPNSNRVSEGGAQFQSHPASTLFLSVLRFHSFFSHPTLATPAFIAFRRVNEYAASYSKSKVCLHFFPTRKKTKQQHNWSQTATLLSAEAIGFAILPRVPTFPRNLIRSILRNPLEPGCGSRTEFSEELRALMAVFNRQKLRGSRKG